MKICLDVGHGHNNRVRGKYDPGASTKYGEEHVKVTGMAYRLKADLERLGHKVLVLEDMPLTERDDAAKKWKADLLVSLHFNAGGGKGTEVWCNTAFDFRSRKVAKYLRYYMKRLGFTDRGTKYTDKFAVLRANSKDCLLEICFIDSSADMKRFNDNVDKVELAILNGILVGMSRPSVGSLPRL